ncbi:MAG: hypothetical protein GXO25_04225 [Euryarchaeota archaeon]|nr:hypothetical protein [Euryarchaeota archaeon]
MPMKRLLSFLFLAIMVSTVFASMPGHASSEHYILQIYDSQGRYLDPNNPNIYNHAQVVIQKDGYLWRSNIGTYSGKGQVNNISFSTDASRIHVIFYWYGNPVYDTDVPLTSSVVKVQMSITPAVPITTYQTEAVAVSSDMHEVSTKFYDVMFGTGNNQDQIQVKIGGQNYIMPVSLALNYNSNSDTKPFRFLAQNPSHPVEGEDKFLIWTTAKYWSSVKSEKVGDNMMLMVWTYGYTDVSGAWRDKVIAAIMAGAVLGTLAGGPEGALAGGAIAGMATAIAWAVDPELVDLSAHTGIGVVVGLFTPRYFQLQGVGGFGANGTKGTVTISNIPASTRFTTDGTSYEIYSESNTLQVGVTKDWGTSTSAFYDFETGAQGWKNISTTQTNVHAGLYAGTITSGSYAISPAMGVHNDSTYKISYDFWVYVVDSSYTEDVPIQVVDNTGAVLYSKTLYPTGGAYKEETGEIQFTISDGATAVYFEIREAKRDGTTNYYATNIDNVKISIQNTGAYRYIFDTSQSGGSGVVRYMFGTIPVIAPSSQGGTPIQNRYTLIAIDMARQDGALAVDWASRLVTLSPARIMIKSDTWTETAWLLGTDDKDGFKGVNFTIVNPKWFVYKVDFWTYYMFTTPDNWTVSENWSPLMANNTTVYIPSWYPGGWDVTKYNLQAWWNNLPLAWKAFVMALPLLILFLILLIIAPWVIVALIKGIAMVIRALGKGFGAVGKAFAGRKRGR